MCSTTALPLCRAIVAVGLVAAALPAGADVSMSADVGAAQRYDEFSWNIADTSGSPNVLSELTWRDVKTNEAVFNLELEERRVMFLGRLAYGEIGDGEIQDSDYSANNRQGEFMRSLSAASGVNKEVEAVFGYRIGPDAWSLIPLAGYAVQGQELRMTDGVGVIGGGDYTGLNSSYNTRWRSWLAGLDARCAPRKQWQFDLSARRLWSDYEGKANWNLVEAFAHPLSFRQVDRGVGYRYEARAEYRFTPQWGLAFSYAYQRLSARNGVDTAFYSDGSASSTVLNGVEWTFRRVGLALTGRFD